MKREEIKVGDAVWELRGYNYLDLLRVKLHVKQIAGNTVIAAGGTVHFIDELYPTAADAIAAAVADLDRRRERLLKMLEDTP